MEEVGNRTSIGEQLEGSYLLMNAKQRRSYIRTLLRDQVTIPSVEEVREQTILVRLFPDTLTKTTRAAMWGTVAFRSLESYWRVALVHLRYRNIAAGYFLRKDADHPLSRYYITSVGYWLHELKGRFDSLREKAVEYRTGKMGAVDKNAEPIVVDWELAHLHDQEFVIDEVRAALYWYMLGKEREHVQNQRARSILNDVLASYNRGHDPHHPDAAAIPIGSTDTYYYKTGDGTIRVVAPGSSQDIDLTTQP